MENMRKRIKIRIIENEKDINKHVSRPAYINYVYFDKRLVAVHEKKDLLTLNKPIYLTCTVLELSKLEMYKLHYGVMKDRVDIFSLKLTDTESFIYEINKNVNEIIHQHKEFFNLSNYSKVSKYFCIDNKKVLGKMKDEYGGKIIYEITALKSKMYSICDVNKNEKSVHKGHSSSINYEELKDTHFNKKVIRHTVRGIKSKKHELVTHESNKTSLSDFDDKRYILDDGINALPYGHKDILINKSNNFFFLIYKVDLNMEIEINKE